MNNPSKLSYKNKQSILNSNNCGCFYCLSIFSKDQIKFWIDDNNTAVCPKCNVDSVLGDSVCEINIDFLEKANNIAFNKKGLLN